MTGHFAVVYPNKGIRAQYANQFPPGPGRLYRDRPDSIRDNPKFRAKQEQIRTRTLAETNNTGYICTRDYDWKIAVKQRNENFRQILRERVIPEHTFFTNGALFLYSERSWGIPANYNDLDSQTIEELRAEVMYK